MAGEPTFKEVIRQIMDGDNVNAATINQPLAQLDNNTRYLRMLLDQLQTGAVVLARDQLIESAAVTGMPVYFDAATGEFKRAIGALVIDSDGSFRTSASTQVLGIVYSRKNSTTGTVLLSGMADVDLSNAVDGDVATGLYYLSNATAGKLVADRPPVGVSVLQVAGENDDGTHKVFVSVTFHDLLESHRHYEFALQPYPAGDVSPPDVGDPHTITNADVDVEGWLPADHEIFAGRAPAGAAFGYNISASALRNLWPPMPAKAYLEWNRGGDGELLGQGVNSQLCIIDRYGIWWMTDCYDRVPWQTDLDTTSSLSESESLVDCPLTLEPTLTLWFTKPVFANTGTWVSSLQAAENSGIVLRCVDTGEAATTGHLEIDLNLALRITTTTAEGHTVLKTLENNQFQAGPVVESIKPIGNNITINSNVSVGADGRRVGRIEIAVEQNLEGGEVAVDSVRLNGAEEAYVDGVLGISLRADRYQGFRGRITIPGDLLLPTDTRLKLVFWILNRSNADIPAEIFELSYLRVPEPGSTASDLPDTTDDEVSLAAIPAQNISCSAVNQYVKVESETFPVLSGEQVLFTLLRRGDEDGFNGDLLVLKQIGKYVRPS